MFYDKKTAIVTGGSEGIGKAVAMELARRGSHLLIVSRSPGKLAKAKEELESTQKNSSQRIESLALDLTDWESTKSELHPFLERNPPDLLINCAGFARPGFFQDVAPEQCQQMMAVNYMGIVHSCQAVLPYMLKKGRGWIVNTSSMAGFLPLFGYTGYCASKYAVVGFSQALDAEIKTKGIRVLTLCPPNTRTPGLEAENRHKPPEVLAIEEKAKTLEPESVALALLRAIPRNKPMIIPTFEGRLAYLLSRYFPSFLKWLIRRR